MYEFRITYQIERRIGVHQDFTPIGFGTSGDWLSVDKAAYAVLSDVEHGRWETEPGQPDSDVVRRELHG